MIPHLEMQDSIHKINEQFSPKALWYSYKIRMFEQNNLVIGGSLDWVGNYNLDLIFEKVIFFNSPYMWYDTQTKEGKFLRLASLEEFKNFHPDFDTTDCHIFAIDLYLTYDAFCLEHNIYYIVAQNISLKMFTAPIGNETIKYEDPFGNNNFLCRKNRVSLLK